MALVGTEAQRLGNVVKYEHAADIKFCRKVVNAYEAASTTYNLGTVLGRTLASGAATATVGAGNTGNGAMGSITVASNARVGMYTLRITAASTNAGSFELRNAAGALQGTGTVGTAFSGAGLSFTLADGSTDFVVGDTFTINVTGSERYKVCEYTATDGSSIPHAIVIGVGPQGVGFGGTIAATTATPVLVLERGPAIVADAALTFGASYDSAAKKAAAYIALAALGIVVETQI